MHSQQILSSTSSNWLNCLHWNILCETWRTGWLFGGQVNILALYRNKNQGVSAWDTVKTWAQMSFNGATSPCQHLLGQKITLIPFSELHFLVNTQFSLNDISLVQ